MNPTPFDAKGGSFWTSKSYIAFFKEHKLKSHIQPQHFSIVKFRRNTPFRPFIICLAFNPFHKSPSRTLFLEKLKHDIHFFDW